ncbi:hypothetical protein HUN08_02915 [Gordonia sp. X0973]|uniref:type VII secretion target n=1 Tax=Gordonia sp. X0973 TaxID=2742602 RepID=UPI0013EB9015|nr:type VII secretion target [Gordonia sp. X0973]QKT06262.1 hypothetical protein HUN08_02915 [Gordonia sp. X0973]
MRVEPKDLREAATKIDGGWKPPSNPANAFTLAGIAVSPTDTSHALRAAGAAVASALSVLDSRRDEIVHVLRVSADRYQGTDEYAARRIAALGSLNDAPHVKG